MLLEVCLKGSMSCRWYFSAENSFAFFMAGKARDCTEIMILNNTAMSWKMDLFLPLITVL